MSDSQQVDANSGNQPQEETEQKKNAPDDNVSNQVDENNNDTGNDNNEVNPQQPDELKQKDQSKQQDQPNESNKPDQPDQPTEPNESDKLDKQPVESNNADNVAEKKENNEANQTNQTNENIEKKENNENQLEQTESKKDNTNDVDDTQNNENNQSNDNNEENKDNASQPETNQDDNQTQNNNDVDQNNDNNNTNDNTENQNNEEDTIQQEQPINNDDQSQPQPPSVDEQQVDPEQNVDTEQNTDVPEQQNDTETEQKTDHNEQKGDTENEENVENNEIAAKLDDDDANETEATATIDGATTSAAFTSESEWKTDVESKKPDVPKLPIGPIRQLSEMELERERRISAILESTQADKYESILPAVACIRCNNAFYLKHDEYHQFSASEPQTHLTHAFAFIPKGNHKYHIIDLNSGMYCDIKEVLHDGHTDSVDRTQTTIDMTTQDQRTQPSQNKSAEKREDRYKVQDNVNVNDNNQIEPSQSQNDSKNDTKFILTTIPFKEVQKLSTKRYQFQIELTHDGKGLRATITKKLPNGEKIYMTLKPNKTVVFEKKLRKEKNVKKAKKSQHMNQIFEIKSLAAEDDDDDELNIVWLLDLVQFPRPEKVGQTQVDTPEMFPEELYGLIINVFLRFDTMKLGYAPFFDIWFEIVQYSDNMIPQIVIEKIENGLSDYEHPEALVHLRDLIKTMEVVWETFISDIAVAKEEERRAKALLKKDPVEVKLRRLDSDILEIHPFIQQWNEMTDWQKKLYDFKLWIHRLTSSKQSGFFLWRPTLAAIQANFGESILAFFAFTRWLFLINLTMSIIFLIVIIPHATQFNYSAPNPGTWVNIFLGLEFTESWYYYGAYRTDYTFSVPLDIGFLWVIACGFSLIICIVAVLHRVIGSSLDVDYDQYTFSRNVFAKYDHTLHHKESVEMQQNSILITLHETLLQKLDESLSKLTWVLVLRRFIGTLLTLLIATISALSIVVLIAFETDIIVPQAERLLGQFGARISTFIVPAGVSFIKALTPRMVQLIVAFERYSAEINFQQIFLRTFLLRMFAVIITLFQTAVNAESLENEAANANPEDNIQFLCAETRIGSVLFRFVLFDLVTEIVMTQIVPFVFSCFQGKSDEDAEFDKAQKTGGAKGRAKTGHGMMSPRKRGFTKDKDDDRELSDSKNEGTEKAEFSLKGEASKAQFDVPNNLLDVMYRQTIVWSALCFSPMIAWLATGATFLSFWLKKRYVNRTPACGPHENRNIQSEFDNSLETELPPVVRIVLSYVTNGVLLLPILALTVVYAFYVRRKRRLVKSRLCVMF